MIPERYLINPCQDFTAQEFERAKTAHFSRREEAAARRLATATGPRTSEGRAAYLQAARRRGYAGAAVILDEENRQAYDDHLDSYAQAFHPVTQPECDSVRRAADAQWRFDRLTSIETALLDLDVSYESPIIDGKVLGTPELHHRLALSFLSHLDNTGRGPFEFCRRLLTAAQRDLEQSVKFFYYLQDRRSQDDGCAAPEPVSIALQPTGSEQQPGPSHSEAAEPDSDNQLPKAA